MKRQIYAICDEGNYTKSVTLFSSNRCVICMTDFAMGDPIRFLPCMHIYHKDCIEDWLVRSFTCPSCMEPVEAALLSTYYEASTE